MFNPIEEVPTIAFCKKIKELGYPQNGRGWYWIKWKKAEPYILAITFDERNWHRQDGITSSRPKFYIKAPTNSEVGKWLPEGFHEFKLDNRFWIKDKKNYNYVVNDTNEVIARIKMWIWLKKNAKKIHHSN